MAEARDCGDGAGSAREVIARAITAVEPPDAKWSARAAARQDHLAMPRGSLGRLLPIGRQLAALQRTDRPTAYPAVVAIFAADHGVAAAGVSADPPEVTGQRVANYARGGAAINAIATRVGAALRVVDLGVAHPPTSLDDGGMVASWPIRRGTSNFLEGPAMTGPEAEQAVRVGLELAAQWTAQDHFHTVVLGDMGTGNTPSAAALAAALTGASTDLVVGRGTGLDDDRLAFQREVVAAALARHVAGRIALWDLLARLGGFEILGLAGLALGAAAARAVVVLDGFISSVAGLVAAQLCPAAVGAMIAGHLGTEPGHAVVLEALGLEPLLRLDLHLGEGTGAALALPIIAAAADLLRDRATFDDAGASGPAVPGDG